MFNVSKDTKRYWKNWSSIVFLYQHEVIPMPYLNWLSVNFSERVTMCEMIDSTLIRTDYTILYLRGYGKCNILIVTSG